MYEDPFVDLRGAANVPSLSKLLSELCPDKIFKIAYHAWRIVIGSNFVGIVDFPSLPCCLTNELAISKLSFDLNTPFEKARSLPHLLLAKMALLDQFELIREIPKSSLLAFRILFLWQKILEQPSTAIKDMMDDSTANYSEWVLSQDEWVLFFLERAGSHLFYYDYDKCKEYLQKAFENSEISVELAGKLGKRTRFQQSNISQLVLKTESQICMSLMVDDDIPTNCTMNDETLLEKVHLLDSSSNNYSQLSDLQLAVILALYRLERRTEYNDDLLIEKINAYLDEVIAQRRCWPVQCAALLARSDIEKHRKRRVERACSQTELISKLMDGIDDKTPLEKKWLRCALVLASGLEPFWEVHVIHAEILCSLGCISDALYIFERLEKWNNVIDCYKQLGQLEKSESLIRRLIDDRPIDSMLYCYLGDITLESSYYEKAIEISNDRNARARKSLGYLMLTRNHYDLAYDHFRRSLDLQPIQLGVWFNAGHCAWKLDRFSESATCYHRCVSLEPDHFEAWNNLSASYIRLGQKERARRILQEALKYNYEHAKVWENYLLLCIDTGEFLQAIHSYHRLLDLNKRQHDDEVLEIITGEVLQAEKEVTDEDSRLATQHLKNELIKLFARITTVQSLSSKAWKAYASLKRPNGDDNLECEKYIQLLERSLLVETNKPNWVNDLSQCNFVFTTAIELAEERLRLATRKGTEAIKPAKSRVRMTLRPLLTILEREYGSKGANCESEEVKENVTKLISILSQVAE